MQNEPRLLRLCVEYLTKLSCLVIFLICGGLLRLQLFFFAENCSDSFATRQSIPSLSVSSSTASLPTIATFSTLVVAYSFFDCADGLACRTTVLSLDLLSPVS